MVAEIDQLERTKVRVTEIERRHDRHHGPLTAGLLLWITAYGVGLLKTEAWP